MIHFSFDIHKYSHFIRTPHCRAEILRPYEHDPLDVERKEDIGGDMNHIHRVTIQLLCSRHNGNGSDSSHMSVATVIVKTAPDEVLVCPIESVNVTVDKFDLKFVMQPWKVNLSLTS